MPHKNPRKARAWRRARHQKRYATDPAYRARKQAAHRAWYQKNQKHAVAYAMKYKKEHPEKQNKGYWRERYKKDMAWRERRKAESRHYMVTVKYAWIKEYKAKVGCKNCGERHPAVLEFHHKDPRKKEFGVAARKTMPKNRLMREIRKCVVLCSNCHKKVHYGR